MCLRFRSHHSRFPGIESTRNDIHQLLVDLLFKKITNSFKIKIVELIEPII